MARGFHPGKREVTRVRPRRQRHRAALLRHLPVRGRIRHEAVDRGDLHGVVLRPQAALAAKRWNPALRRDARAGERNTMTRGRKHLRRPLDCHAKTTLLNGLAPMSFWLLVSISTDEMCESGAGAGRT